MMKMFHTRNIILFFIILFLSNNLVKSNISPYGYPFVKNYTKDEFKAAAQSYDVIQGKEGEMYFANNYGVLEFNGVEWSLIAQPTNKSAILSLHVDKEGIIYVGAQNEFGYLKTNLNGQKYYVSLLDKIPEEYRDCDGIREVFETPLGISFISSDVVFNYLNDTVSIISHNQKFKSISHVSDSILVLDELNNLYVVKENHLKNTLPNVKSINWNISNIFSDKEGRLFFYSVLDGFFYFQNGKIIPVNTELNKLVTNNPVRCFKQLKGGYMAIGTVQNGLIIIDENNNPVQAINKSNGLQDNKIYAIGTDVIGNLWVACHDGIDYVEIASPFYQINNTQNIPGAVFSIYESNDELFLGTSAGMVYSDWDPTENSVNSELDFKPFPGIYGHVWNLNYIDNYLYVCSSRGLFKIDEQKTIEKIEEVTTGAWLIKPLYKGSNLYIQGGYEGINIFKKQDNGLQFVNHVKGFNETSRVIEVDDEGTIWMAHGLKGVYKFKLNQALDSAINVEFYNWDKGFPSSLFISVYKIKNEILFATEWGVFQYLSEKDTMVIHPYYKEITHSRKPIRLLKELGNDMLYVRGNDMDEEIGIVEFFEGGKYNINKAPFQKLKGQFVPGFDNVTTTKSGNLIFGTKNGLIYFNRKFERDYNKPYKTNLTAVTCLTNDSLLFGDYDGDDTTNAGINSHIVSIPYFLNSFEFSYAAAFYESIEDTQYSWFLEGYDSKWSKWRYRNRKQYTKLKSGKYVFHVKSKNIYGIESEEDVFAFEIQTPWYKTNYAYFIYALVVLIFLLLIIWFIKRLIKKEKARIIAKEIEEKRSEINKHLHDKLSAEKELRNIQEERSLKDIEDKDARLASSTMHLLQMNSTITQIKDELNNALIHLDPDKRNIFRKLISSIDQKAQKNESWENFELHFNKVHNDFLQRIKEDFPDLSQRDIRLCAYLRLNLSSKEIANLMAISIRSVESLRYRVRKKIQLDSDKNLTDYLLSY